MTHTVLVLNPNSSTRVTAAIDRAVNPAVGAGERYLRCVTLDDGPAGIVTQADADRAATLVGAGGPTPGGGGGAGGGPPRRRRVRHRLLQRPGRGRRARAHTPACRRHR